MTKDQDGHDDRSRQPPAPAFRPLGAPDAAPRRLPRFLRPAASAPRRLSAPQPGRDGPHFARFLAAVGAVRRPAAASVALRAPAADVPQSSGGFQDALRRAGPVRKATLASSALAAAILLLALLDGRDGELAAPRAGAAHEGALAEGAREPLAMGSLLSAYRPPAVPLAVALPLSAGREQGPAALQGLVGGSKLASLARVAAGKAAATVAEQAENPLYELAYALERRGDAGHALAAYQRAAAADPEHAATFYNWGYLLQRQGDLDGARQRYREALRLDPRHAFAHYNLAWLLQRAGEEAAAAEHYRAAIAADPSFAWAHYNLGWLEQTRGRDEAALADYRRSLELDPGLTLARENIAAILRQRE
jgi:tetratricopeptide (TPR) repeat protein